MKRFARHLFTLVAAVSLLMCVATMLLWVRSYGFTEKLGWRNEGGWREVRSAKGHVVVELLLADWSRRPNEWRGLTYERDRPSPPFNYFIFLNGEQGDRHAGFEVGGFAWRQIRNPRRGLYRLHTVAPFWSLTLLTLLPPATWITLRVRQIRKDRRRRRLGLCATCGYDLRGSPERCPECGVIAPSAANSSSHFDTA